MPYSRVSFIVAALAIGLLDVPTVNAQSPQLIAPTPALTPAEQLQKFHLPPGFEIQLVVAEPGIGQPMNLNFDAAGRLWITHSVEYPWPVQVEGLEAREARFGKPSQHPPRDRLTVCAGIHANGKPQTISHFATGLNIPIGHVPVPDGAIVYSIPDIYKVTDTNGDGLGDRSNVLYGRFGNVDTHGMASSFTRGLDGWIYGCHGFRNHSLIKDAIGKVTTLNSGNTYRFTEDGRHFEQWTHGQVNPYGLTFDAWGNLYSADCHSKPLTSLIRGAYYSSFGKPHDGTGFGPDMIEHSHGSTGICGPAYYAATAFPPDYRENLFLCNPVTGRVHRDKLVWTGSSPLVETQPDFITCDDGWFRPVDCKLGPDGALYIADFYNCIIGHYEVPLDHPRRDRTHGRIWRVIYTGNETANNQKYRDHPVPPDLTELALQELASRLGENNLVVRTLATNELLDRVNYAATLKSSRAAVSADVVAAIKKLFAQQPSPEQRAHGFWVLHRLGALEGDFRRQFLNDESPLVRAQLARIVDELPARDPTSNFIAIKLLTDKHPMVQRAAAQAIRRPHAVLLERLLRAMNTADKNDTHLYHTCKVALRDQLVNGIPAGVEQSLVDSHVVLIADMLAANTSRQAALGLARLLCSDGYLSQPELQTAGSGARERMLDHLRQVAELLPDEFYQSCASRLFDELHAEPEFQAEMLLAIADGLRRAGVQPKRAELAKHVRIVTLELLAQQSPTVIAWQAQPLPGQSGPATQWGVGQRRCADGREISLHSSFPAGEAAVGQWVSEAFALPEQLSFWIAGHAGFPDAAPHRKSFVRMIDADTQAVLATAFPPRNDVAQEVVWKFPRGQSSDNDSRQPRRGYVVITDGDAGGAYAWLAVGRYSVNALNPQAASPLKLVPELIAAFQPHGISAELRKIINDRTAQTSRRFIAAEGLVVMQSNAFRRALLHVARQPGQSESFREQLLQVLGNAAGALTDDTKQQHKLLKEIFNVLPRSGRQQLAQILVTDRAGTELLLYAVEQGHTSPGVLTLPAIVDTLAAYDDKSFTQRHQQLTANLPAIDANVQKLIAQQRELYGQSQPSPDRGQAVFKQHCAVCHRIGNEGSLIGPQLDGVGIRGLERLLEDVLDPDRNVDAAFRISTIATTAGQIKTGLYRRTNGAVEIFADNKGKEFSIASREIAERKLSSRSLMPGNLHEILPPADLPHLLHYLLQQRARN